MRLGHFLIPLAIAGSLVWPFGTAQASNPCCKMVSIGVPGANITLDGVGNPSEWAGAGPATNVGPPTMNAPSGTITVLHKADGLYFLIVVNDSSFDPSDAINIRFDMDHSGGATPDNDDFGVLILRNGQATWGPAKDSPATWGPVAAGTVGVTSGASTWTAEFHLPTGAPSGLQISGAPIAVYFNFLDADQALGNNSDKYAQWPPAPMGNLDEMLDTIPDQWADLIFDPKTTFPDLDVKDVRRFDAGPGSYYSLSYSAANSFQAEVANPGGTVIADASNVRINLYLAARGIGESWHRLDKTTVLNNDCADTSANWPWSTVLAKTDVCSGNTPLPDISTTSLNNVIANTAKYTIQKGVDRIGNDPLTSPLTIPNTTDTDYSVNDWQLDSTQDPFFVQVTMNNNTYDRGHECMLAEAIFPNDPNPNNNTHQVNMEFLSTPGGGMRRFPFSLGWAGFGKYDPAAGKQMVLQVARHNMDERFRFTLPGLKETHANTFVADLKGQLSLPVQAQLQAPPADAIGKTLKENLVVPPKAGGQAGKPESGLPPVYVKVTPDSTLWIVSYSLNDKDEQFVSLDRDNKLLHSGPAGIPDQRVRGYDDSKGVRLVRSARLGELVMSFDGFKTGFGIAEGVQVKVPHDAEYLALAVNDVLGHYNDNGGTGYRVKILVRPQPVVAELAAREIVRRAVTPAAAAPAASFRPEKLEMTPILDVIPRVCVSGYEDINQKRVVHGQPKELFRYVGDVCWGILNVMASEEPREEKGDTPPR
jgi:hypothetical protein